MKALQNWLRHPYTLPLLLFVFGCLLSLYSLLHHLTAMQSEQTIYRPASTSQLSTNDYLNLPVAPTVGIANWQPWLIGIALLFITIIITSHLFRTAQFNRRLTQLNQTLTTEISERQRIEARWQQLADERGHLLGFVHAAASTTTLNALIELILDSFNQVVPFTACSIYEADPQANLLRPIQEARPTKYQHRYVGLALPLDKGIVGAVFASRQSECVNYAQHDPRFVYPEGDFAPQDEHFLCFPLQAKAHTYGIMMIGRVGGTPFSTHDFELAQLYVQQVAVIIYNTLLQRQIQKHAEALEERVLERTAALQQSELFVRAILDSLAAHVAVIDQNGRILATNRAWEKFARAQGDTYFQHSCPGINYLDVCRRAESEQLAKSALSGVEQVLVGKVPRFTMEYPCFTSERSYWFLMYATPLSLNDGGAVILHEDITELKEAEGQIRQLNENLEQRVQLRTAELEESLHEKEALLQEVHHRVKNNLQIIASLLNLQADFAEKAAVQAALRESQQRMRAMTLIHERLYHFGSIAHIDFADYIQGLMTHLQIAYDLATRQVKVEIMAEPLLLHVETAVPLGLILNELVTNAYKHAFPQQSAGQITVRWQCHDTTLCLAVQDNGIGMPSAPTSGGSTLGLTIVHTLVKQLRAQILVDTQQGTAVTITLPARSPQKEKSDDKNHGR